MCHKARAKTFGIDIDDLRFLALQGAAVIHFLQSTGQALTPMVDRIASALDDEPSRKAAIRCAFCLCHTSSACPAHWHIVVSLSTLHHLVAQALFALVFGSIFSISSTKDTRSRSCDVQLFVSFELSSRIIANIYCMPCVAGSW
jgi:hypothetical protein